MLHCSRLSDIRNQHVKLQQPYIEDEEEIISNVVYDDDDKEEIKTTLVKMWYKRLKILQEQQ